MEAITNTVWAWDVAQWVACLPGMHRALDWAWWQMPVILALRWWVWGGSEVKVILGYTEGLRTASAHKYLSLFKFSF